MAPDAHELLARALPDYELGTELGRGALGVVMAAKHRQLGRDVAVKQLMGGAEDEASAARFRHEARILAQLDHPHVVTVYDYREDSSVRLLVMEVMTGGTFGDTCRKGISLETAIAGTLTAASGLHEVHQQGVLHRDVKPENLMLTRSGVLKVTDFGLARGEAADQTAVELTQAGSFLGTPAYAAPEQVAEALATGWPAVGPAADEYTLASVLYFALSGELTHDPEGGLIALCYRRMTDEARPLLDVAPDTPPAVAAVVMRALARDPAGRYDTVETFAVALGEATTAALGAGWSERAAIKIRAAGPIREAAERPAPAEVAAAAPNAVVAATVVLPASGAGTGTDEAVHPAGAPPVLGPATIGARWRWPALAVLLVAVLVVGVIARNRIGSAPAASVPSAASGSSIPGTRPVDLSSAWQFTTGGDVFASPLVTPGAVVIGSVDQKVYSLDPMTGSQRWAAPTNGPVRSSAALSADGQTAFVGSGDGDLYALAVSDGSQRWKADTGYQLVSSPTVANDAVLIGADALYSFAAADGTQRWRFDTGDVVVSSPAVADGVAYVGANNGKVFAVDVATGIKRWDHDTGGAVQSSPVVRDGVVYVGTNANALVALDAASGTERWRADVGSSVRSTPAVSDTSVFVGTAAGQLVALDRTSGGVRWRLTAEANVDSSPLLVGADVVVGSTDANVYVADQATGAVEGRFATGGPVLSSPRASGGRIFVGGYDDKVYALTGLTP